MKLSHSSGLLCLAVYSLISQAWGKFEKLIFLISGNLYTIPVNVSKLLKFRSTDRIYWDYLISMKRNEWIPQETTRAIDEYQEITLYSLVNT